MGCSLYSITLPSNLTSIGDHAFYDCNDLTSITLPAGMAYIGTQAFYTCNNLQTVVFAGNSVSIANANSFDYNSSSGTSLKTAYEVGRAGTYRRSAPGLNLGTWSKSP
jgi:hypothetical protein